MQEQILSGTAGVVQHFLNSVHAMVERLEIITPSSQREKLWEKGISRI